MILFENLPRLLQTAHASDRILDIGGWFRPFNLATHVVDIQPYETRQSFHALDPENVERFNKENWAQIDACKDDWPFPDKYFDFCICSHTLEDLPDPVRVCEQINRVSKAGYIEVPSKPREIFTKKRFSRLRAALNLPLEIGFQHHHWICEINGDEITFEPKDSKALLAARAYLTRADIGRKLTQEEAGICLWWKGGFSFKKVDSNISILRRDALFHIKS
ncbi:MAG: SAM-dependent methyltransferase [Alphaproteobacteria bacterium]|jgi:SAM-dependent methyltransferase